MGVLTSPLCCAVKCCGCIVLSQLIGLLMSVGMLVLFLAAFYFYVLPWGEDKIVSELGLPSGTDYDSISSSIVASNNCSGCVFGTNTEWPTTTTGSLHFLDTSAGTTISSVVATTLVATAATGVGTMIWASIFPSMASVLSFSGGFYEMTHILEQAQYIGMIGQLQLRGAPTFLNQFSKELSWTNFNLPHSVTSKFLPTRRLSLTDTAAAAVQPKYDGETGPAKYAKTLGVEPKDLFFYTLKLFAAVIVIIHVLYVLLIMVLSCISKKKSFGQIAGEWYRKVIWACILALLLAQYIFAMTGSYYIYENTRTDDAKDSNFALACALLVLAIGFAVIFGIAVVANNTDELKDIGSVEHDQRPFAAKYSAYYDEYNFDNRFFFVPRILLAVATGVVVGVVKDPTKQLFFVLGATFLYLVLILIREPNLLRFLYYIGLTSVFMKVVLVCMMLVLVQDDFFPQKVRDKVAYAIIGINIFIFFLLFLRQAYLIVYKLVRTCKHKGKNSDDSDDDDDRRQAIEEANRGGRHYERLNSTGGPQAGRQGANASVNEPYARSQHDKEQNFLANQQQNPYARGDNGIQGGAAALGAGGAAGAYGANKYGQQQQAPSPNDVYGQQAGVRGSNSSQDRYGNQPPQPGYGNQPAQPGYGDNQSRQSGYGDNQARQSGHGGNQQQGGAFGQNRYGSGSDAGGYGANTAAPQGRSIADRYIGAGVGVAAVAGAGAVVAANARSSENEAQRSSQPIGAAKPEPEKFTWRRNMERRAAETAAAEEAANPQRRSFVRMDSDDSYGTETRSGRGNGSEAAYGAAAGTVAATAAVDAVYRDSSPRSRAFQPSYSTEASEDWFDQRAPSDVGTDVTADSFLRSGDGSSRGDREDASSFMTLDSYASHPSQQLDSQTSFDSSTDGLPRGVSRMDTQTLDHLAVEYLKQAGGDAATAENDIGDEDDEDDEEEEEAHAPMLDFPKSDDADDDEDETESVDIDAAPADDDSEDEDETKAVEVNVDVDVDRASVDIDDDDDSDIDIDEISSRDNDSMLELVEQARAGRGSYENIKQLDEIGLLRDSAISATSGRDDRNSYLSASSSGYNREMSEVSLRSDDDASFYVDGRQPESPSAAARQAEREKAAGPLKL